MMRVKTESGAKASGSCAHYGLLLGSMGAWARSEDAEHSGSFIAGSAIFYTPGWDDREMGVYYALKAVRMSGSPAARIARLWL